MALGAEKLVCTPPSDHSETRLPPTIYPAVMPHGDDRSIVANGNQVRAPLSHVTTKARRPR